MEYNEDFFGNIFSSGLEKLGYTGRSELEKVSLARSPCALDRRAE